MHPLRCLFLLFGLVVLGLPAVKILALIDWSWWIVAAPVWLTSIVALGAWPVIETLLFRLPPQ